MDIFEHWIVHKIVDYLSDNKHPSNNNNNSNKTGRRIYWTSAVGGENLFKIYAEEYTNEDYEEINVDDTLFIRTYNDNGKQTYISTDTREWTKYTGEVGFYDSETPRLRWLSDELFNKYSEIQYK